MPKKKGTQPSADDIKKMKVAQLKVLLNIYGLDVSGNKPDLIKRLTSHFNEDGDSSSEEDTESTQDDSKDDSEDLVLDKSSGKVVRWVWANDGPKGSQSISVDYSNSFNKQLEEGFQQYLANPIPAMKRVKVDDERYIDLKKMLQRRYDDPSRRRAVERKLDDPPKSSKKTTNGSQTTNAATASVAKTASIISAPSIKKSTSLKKSASTTSTSAPSSSTGSSAASSSAIPGTSTAVSTSTVAAAAAAILGLQNDDDSDSEDESKYDDDTDYIQWSWAGDSPGAGHQDMWVEYSAVLCRKFEAAFTKGKKSEVRVDSERFVDLQNMLQRRYDDPNKRRNVKRDASVVVKIKKRSVKNTKQSTSSKRKKGESDSDDDASQNNATTTKKQKVNVAATSVPAVAVPAQPSIVSNVSDAAKMLAIPSHWDLQAGLVYAEVTINSSSPEFIDLKTAFLNTIEAYHINNASGHKIIFHTFKVTRIVRIQNPMQWLRYHTRKQKIEHDCVKGLQVLAKVESSACLDTKVNEFILYHGLNECHIPGIIKYGFDPRYCSLEGMFGAGIYFADQSSKSNQYVHSGSCAISGPGMQAGCKCKKSDECCLLGCRVALGDTLVEKKFRGNSPGQYWHGRRTEPEKPGGGTYHSVVGESRKNDNKSGLNLREYIVYESSQIYPEYKIYYQRI